MRATAPCYDRSDTPLLVGHLMASAPPRSRVANAGSSALSILLHASLLTVAVALTSGPVARKLTAPEPVVYQPILPIDPPAPPPPVAAAAAAAPAVDALQGFKVLTAPPIDVPTVIPPIRPGLATNEADYAGVGAIGGSASGTRAVGTPAEPNIADAPVFTPVAVAPELKNRSEVERALRHAYPGVLRDAGITGRVIVWALVDEQGQVMKAQVQKTSGVQALDDAALGVARTMEFTPGINHDVRVKVWVSLPIDFRIER